jgi:hypothetical protein
LLQKTKIHLQIFPHCVILKNTSLDLIFSGGIDSMKLAISMNFPHTSPEEWATLHRNAGLEAVTFPCDHTAPVSLIDRYVAAAKDASLRIAEVGAFNCRYSYSAAKI